jgi:hypothetical protein
MCEDLAISLLMADHRDFDNPHASCEGIFDVVVCGIMLDEFLFQVLAVASSIVPDG